jgi:hypothetical protein
MALAALVLAATAGRRAEEAHEQFARLVAAGGQSGRLARSILGRGREDQGS